jgi:LacI family transcriptional regulator
MTIPITSRPTITDVARLCGLSKATVSKALNAPEGGSPLIAEPTRMKVLDVARSLGYRPSWRATTLARKRSQTIAIAYSSATGAVPRGVYFEVVDGLEAELSARDYLPTFLHLRGVDERVDRVLGDARFDGLISLGVIDPAVLRLARDYGLPCVLINSGADDTWPRVNVNDVQGSGEAVKHLLALGHTNILYYAGLTMFRHPSAQQRYDAYRRGMADAGLTPAEPFIGTADEFVKHLIALGDARPTAVIDYEHWSAIRLLQALWRAGISVPNDMSLVTFNDTHPVADVIPPLTTVALPGREMAKRAVDMLLKRLDGGDATPTTLVLDEKLVVRESTAPPRRAT